MMALSYMQNYFNLQKMNTEIKFGNSITHAKVFYLEFLKRRFLPDRDQDQDSLVKTKTETKTVDFLNCQDQDQNRDIFYQDQDSYFLQMPRPRPRHFCQDRDQDIIFHDVQDHSKTNLPYIV